MQQFVEPEFSVELLVSVQTSIFGLSDSANADIRNFPDFLVKVSRVAVLSFVSKVCTRIAVNRRCFAHKVVEHKYCEDGNQPHKTY